MVIYRDTHRKPFKASSMVMLFIIIGGLAAIGIAYFIDWKLNQNEVTNKPIACSKLYSVEQTEDIVANNSELVKRVEQAGGYHIYVNDRHDCRDKGELIIMYTSPEQAEAIKEIVGSLFQGLPYRLRSN